MGREVGVLMKYYSVLHNSYGSVHRPALVIVYDSYNELFGYDTKTWLTKK